MGADHPRHGTSGGIWRATARLFQHRGWNVAATMRAPEREEEVGRLERALVTRLDVTDPESVRSAVAETLERFGAIDVLVKSAACGAVGALEASSMDSRPRSPRRRP